MAGANPMKQGSIFPAVATLQQSRHVLRAAHPPAAAQLRTKVSTGRRGKIFRKFFELAACPCILMFHIKLAVTADPALPPRL
jgi:hypothetical protein